MAKTTKTSTNGSENFETALHTGAEAVKDGFEKAAKGYEQFVTFSKDTAEAMLKSANAAGKGFESFNSEVFAYARKSVEDGVSATKAIMAAKSVDEAIQLQTEFGKNAFETYVDELAKFGDMALALARESAEPMQARFSAFASLVRTA
jgi:phasin family protein